MRTILRNALHGIAVVGLAWPWLANASGDPGVVLELDRSSFVLQARDLRTQEQGPEFSIVTGSPSHPTPAGSFPVYAVVHNPGWKPGDTARSYGAEPIAPSMEGPLGVGKIVFARDGIALHGGADPVLIGKPVSLGCVRALDDDFSRLVRWLDAQGALLAERPQRDGELHQGFRRPIRVVIH